MPEPVTDNRVLQDALIADEQQANPLAHGDELPTEPVASPNNGNWLERNADSITCHGRLIATSGLAGEEFDRI